MANVDVTRIASNIGALNALNSLENINKQLAVHQTRLSTGKRINSAADDPAGLTIATKMLSRSEGMKVALDNISDASNMLSVAESGLSKMNDILVIMRDKAEQAASDTLGTTERDAIATQLSAYANQIDSMVAETKWNNSQLLDGTVNKRFQTGVDDGEYTTFQMSSKFDPTTLGISSNVAADTANNFTVGAITALGTPGAAFAGLSKLSTGSYSVNITGVAASGTQGAASILNNSSIPVAATANTSIGSEVTNGAHTVKIVSAAAGNITYSLDGGANTTAAYGTGGAIALGTSGLSLNAGGTDAASALAAWNSVATGGNNTITVDYIKAGAVKYNLKSGSGETMSVDADGTNGTTNPSSIVGYGAFGTSTDTGRGLSITFGASGAAVVGSTTLDYKQTNAYSVDVSSATKASTYMTTVNTAMDTVNSSLASLGSLMARLNFKSEQVSGAQVNMEGAYSRIMNANMAEEQMNASKYSILQQTAVAMLAQANQAPQSLLTLFR
jgi:flagellin